MYDFSDLRALIDGSPKHIPTLYNFEPCCATIGGGFSNLTEYYLDVQMKIDRQLKLMEMFPDALIFPGTFADFGVIPEATAFGGQIEWSDVFAPYCHASMRSIEDIDRMKPPKPGLSGLTAVLLTQKKIMARELKARGKELRKFSMTMGPIEVAGLILGYDQLFLGLYEDEERVKQLLEMTTQFVIDWLKLQGTVTGENEVIMVADHVGTQVNHTHFEEIFFPYLKAVFDEFKGCIKVYHNEGRHTDAHIETILGLGADIWHYGSDVHDLGDLYSKIGDRIIPFGGLSPHGVLRTGTPEDVRQEALKVKKQAEGRKLLFSSGTGTTPDCTEANMRALLEVAAM